MPTPSLVLLVRIKTSLALEQVMEIAESRADEFRALTGLQQKLYLQDAGTGEIAGLYLWASPEAAAEYRDSELRASIAEAYQAVGEPRVEIFRVLKSLRDDGP